MNEIARKEAGRVCSGGSCCYWVRRTYPSGHQRVHGEGGGLSGYRVAESFGAITRGDTFGRHVKSDGEADDDWDSDGSANYGEWFAGTDPTDTAPLFIVTSMDVESGCVLEWAGETGKAYAIWVSTNPANGFWLAEGDGSSTPPAKTYTAAAGEAEGAFFLLTVGEEWSNDNAGQVYPVAPWIYRKNSRS